MGAASLINISHGARCEAKKVENKSAGKIQQLGGRGSVSPNLGCSPELGKKNKNMQQTSADFRLDSPGVCQYKQLYSEMCLTPHAALTHC